MNLEEYIQLDEREKLRYDFSAENATEAYVSASSIEKYIIYKTYTIKGGWSDELASGKKFRKVIREHYTKRKGRKIINWIQDPDDFKHNPNGLLEQIYMKIWPELELCSDTMTSVQYVMSKCFCRNMSEI